MNVKHEIDSLLTSIIQVFSRTVKASDSGICSYNVSCMAIILLNKNFRRARKAKSSS